MDIQLTGKDVLGSYTIELLAYGEIGNKYSFYAANLIQNNKVYRADAKTAILAMKKVIEKKNNQLMFWIEMPDQKNAESDGDYQDYLKKGIYADDWDNVDMNYWQWQGFRAELQKLIKDYENYTARHKLFEDGCSDSVKLIYANALMGRISTLETMLRL